MTKLDLIEKAARIAVIAHKEQKRKTDDLPYIVHPCMVALKLAKYNFSDTTVAAALVHDVLEDTNVSADELGEALGSEIVEIVSTLSEDKSLPWEERKKKYVEAVRRGSDEVKAISAADKIHNLESVLAAYEEQGEEVWKKFNRGKEKKLWFENEMLRMFKETWTHPLVDEYEALVEKMKRLE